MSEVQLLVGRQARTGEVARADDAGDRLEAIPAERGRIVVEQVALGVQEPVLVQAHGDAVLAQKADQILDQPQRGFGERLRLEIARMRLASDPRVRPQADLLALCGSAPSSKSEVAERVQAARPESQRRRREVGGGDVERLAGVSGEQAVQNIGQPMRSDCR